MDTVPTEQVKRCIATTPIDTAKPDQQPPLPKARMEVEHDGNGAFPGIWDKATQLSSGAHGKRRYEVESVL